MRFIPRKKPDPEQTHFERMLESQIKDLNRVERAMEGVVEAWEACMPSGMDPTFERIAPGGVLVVKIASASQRFLASRALLCGAEAKIVAAAKGKVKAVRLRGIGGA